MPKIELEVDSKHIEFLDKVAAELSLSRDDAFGRVVEQLNQYMTMVPMLDSIADHEQRISKLEAPQAQPKTRKTLSGREIRW